MYNSLQTKLQTELDEIKEAGLYKQERIIITPQGADIKTQLGGEVINFVQTITWVSVHTQKY